MFDRTGFAVYRLYSQDRVLLYIGATQKGKQRMWSHGGDKAWWPDVVSNLTEIDWCATEQEAAALEHRLTQELRPLHNVANTASRRPSLYYVPSGVKGVRRLV
jgi:excinuclease UvrABC nuclease subunit